MTDNKVSIDDVTGLDDSKLDDLLDPENASKDDDKKPDKGDDKGGDDNNDDNNDSDKDDDKDGKGDNEDDKKGEDDDDDGDEDLSKLSPEELLKKAKELNKFNKSNKKQIKDRGEYIEQRNKEIGTLRKAVDDLTDKYKDIKKNKKTDEEIKDEFGDDPVKATKAIIKQKEDEKSAEETLIDARNKEALLTNEIHLNDLFDNKFDEYIPKIAEKAKELKISDEHIAKFKANPYATGPDILINYMRMIQLDEKNAEIAALKKGTKDDAKDKLKKESANSNKPARIRSGDNLGGAEGGDGDGLPDASTTKEVANMKDEDLEKLL